MLPGAVGMRPGLICVIYPATLLERVPGFALHISDSLPFASASSSSSPSAVSLLLRFPRSDGEVGAVAPLTGAARRGAAAARRSLAADVSGRAAPRPGAPSRELARASCLEGFCFCFFLKAKS